MTEVEWALVVAAGLVGGFVNTLAGGGSVIMVPTLLLAGLPADVTNATTRVPILAQCVTSAAAFWRAGRLDLRSTLDVTPLTLIGALAGSYVATIVPNRIFEPVLVGTMMVMALTMLVRPATLAPTDDAEPRRVLGAPVPMLATLAAGFYGGVLQAGAGFVFLALLAGLCRYDLVRANALKAVVMMSYIAVTVAVFAARGRIDWLPAGVMAIGAIAGAWIGARFALGPGVRWIRWIVVVMALALCAWVLVR